MKSLKLQRELLQEISSVLGAKPDAREDPLLCVLEMLVDFGRYGSLALHLCAQGRVFLHARIGAEAPVAVGAGSSVSAAINAGEPTVSRSELQATTAAAAKSQAVVPIRRGAVRVGALVLNSRNAYAFGSAEIAMLKAVARELAVFFAKQGKHYLRNLGAPSESDQSDTVTAAVA